jgi:hypothetical protein
MTSAFVESIPLPIVEIAFNPTDLTSLTQTWTDVSYLVRDFSTHGGRQHYLDRIEASTLSITFDNRTGFFMNGSANGTGQILGTRMPIRVRATWADETYTVFWGVIDTIETSLQDALNSDLYVSASDTLKYLSLRYLYNTQLYAGITKVSSSNAWYNTVNANSYVDNIGSQNGSIVGPFADAEGVLLYDRMTAVDLTNGSTDPSAYIALPDNITYGLEFWVIGQAIQSCTLVPIQDTFNNNDYTLKVDNSGLPYINGATTYSTPPNAINDGYWHHVAVYVTKPGANALMNLAVDGVLVQTITIRSGGADNLEAPGSYVYIGQNVACQIDQVVTFKTGITLTQIQNRYVAGSLLRKDCLAGDFIAQALVMGGRGSVTGGTISVPNYYVDGVAYTAGSASNGVVQCQSVTSTLTGNSVLDTLFQAVETEVGVFYQADDGSLNFHTRAYLYRPDGNAVIYNSRTWTDDETSNYHYEATSFQLTRDDVDTWTTVIVSPQNGTPQIYENTANETRWGQSTLTKSTTGSTLDSAYQTAVYLGNVFATPLARVNTLKLKSETDNGGNNTAMLGVNLQDRITVKRTPINASDAGITNTDMSVESLNHEFASDPGYWHTTFTLDPYPIRFSTQDNPVYFLIASDDTYGSGSVSSVSITGSVATVILSAAPSVQIPNNTPFVIQYQSSGVFSGILAGTTVGQSGTTVLFTITNNTATGTPTNWKSGFGFADLEIAL